MAKLVYELILQLQPTTMGKTNRPYGVGLVLAGVDETGPHVFIIKPDATFTENIGWAMGMRSQAARTFVEKSLDKLPTMTDEELKRMCMKAAHQSLSKEMAEKGNFPPGLHIITKDTPYQEIPAEDVHAMKEEIEGQFPAWVAHHHKGYPVPRDPGRRCPRYERGDRRAISRLGCTSSQRIPRTKRSR